MFTDEQLAQIKRIVREEFEVEARAIKNEIRRASLDVGADLLDIKDGVKDLTIRINKMYALEQEDEEEIGEKTNP